MTIEKTQENGKTIFALDGRLDTTSAPQLQTELIPVFDEAKEIVIDFAKLVYVSSAGLRVLLQGEKTAKIKDASMILTNVSDEIMEVFEMTGFSNILTFA
ncbi:MAG: STAS domain-containing protein [Oscillospiraceae bacterium]|nr:STAS domain-containing protein [Oscillospiraceae bacterium]